MSVRGVGKSSRGSHSATRGPWQPWRSPGTSSRSWVRPSHHRRARRDRDLKRNQKAPRAADAHYTVRRRRPRRWRPADCGPRSAAAGGQNIIEWMADGVRRTPQRRIHGHTVSVDRSEIHGTGLTATEDLPAGSLVALHPVDRVLQNLGNGQFAGLVLDGRRPLDGRFSTCDRRLRRRARRATVGLPQIVSARRSAAAGGLYARRESTKARHTRLVGPPHQRRRGARAVSRWRGGRGGAASVLCGERRGAQRVQRCIVLCRCSAL